MKKSREYIISSVLFCISIVCFCVSAITGITVGINSSIDNIFLYLGLAFLCFGFVLFGKSRKNNDSEEK